MDNLSGSLIKGYELQERIGAGGFGAVYKAYQSTVGREVAIKIILPHFANQPDFIRRFESEAQLIARLEHLHIIPLYDYWRDGDGAYLVMRWLRGGSLREALKNGPFPIEATVQLMDHIASALAAAHRNNIIHRDLKPGNILLDEDGNAYLADFGIAKDVGLKAGITEVDTIVGSPDYLAPEQARSEPVTPRTDIYSLGVVLYETLTGQHPFPHLSAVEQLYKHLNEPLPPITSLPDGLADDVNAVIQKATAKNPLNRYADALEMAAAFRQAVRAMPSENVVEILTQREQDILRRIMDGRSNKEIAQELFITVITVKWYITQIYRKLGVRSRVQAIVRAQELNLISSGTPAQSGAALAERTVVTTGDLQLTNPYKGLRAFQAADNAGFFGREKITDKLVKRLGESGEYSRFLAVIGPSGSGKSSLVKAGLIPAIWRGAIPGSEKWFVVEMLPGARPLDELEVALARVAANQAGSVHEQLRRDENGLLRIAGLILPNDSSELLLVIDQFEEVFTLAEDEAVRAHFLNLLLAAVSDPRSRVRVVITLRADFYDRPLSYPAFGELVRSRMETVLPLSAEELERAIARPAQQVGVSFEPGLVSSMVADVNYQPGALPLLQYALTELFEQRKGRTLTREAYEALGKTTGALAKRAEEIYLGLDDAGREAARQMFLRLVTLGEGVEDTRRRAPRSELLAIATPGNPTPDPSPNSGRGENSPLIDGNVGARRALPLPGDSDLMDDLIDTYAAYRLLSLDHDPGTRAPMVEVAHEAILREWERLRAWLNDSRGEIHLQRQLAHAADEWYAANQEASFLLRGARLEQLEKWTAETQLALTGTEREFLAASIGERERQTAAENVRRERETRLERRSRKFLRTLVAVFALAAVLSGGFGIFAFDQRNYAVLAGDEAARSAAEFRSIALTNGAQQALNAGQPDVALAMAREAIHMDDPPELAQRMFFQAATSTWIQQRYIGHTSGVYDAVFLPDGRRMITVGWDGRAILWDVATGKQLQSIEHEGAWSKIAIHPNGHIVAIGGHADVGLLWDIDTNQVRQFTTGAAWETSPVFNRDGSLLLTGTDTGIVNIWDSATLELNRSFKAHDGLISAINFNSDQSLLITAAWDGQVHIWDFTTGELLQTLDHRIDQDISWVWDALFLPDGERVITGETGGEIFLWNWRSGEKIWTAQNPGTDVQSVALSPDARFFVTGGNDDAPDVHLWDTETGQLIRTYHGHTLRVQRVDVSPDGRFILSASNDGTAILWPVAWEGAQRSFTLPGGGPLHPSRPIIAFIAVPPANPPDSRILFANTNTGAIVQTLDDHKPESPATFSPDGRYFVSNDPPNDPVEGDAYIWDWETGQRLHVLETHGGFIMNIGFSPDGHLLAIGEAQGTRISLWDVQTGALVHNLEGQHDWIAAFVFSPDGKTLYSGARDGSLFVWDVASGEHIGTFAGHKNSLNALDINADGTRLASASNDGTAVIWDTVTGERVATLDRHSGGVYTVDFSPDSRYLVTGSADASLILWDALTGEALRRYVGLTIPPLDVTVGGTFTPDGQSIISRAGAQVTIWDASPLPGGLDAWVENNRYIPDFTCQQRSLYRIEPLCPEAAG